MSEMTSYTPWPLDFKFGNSQSARVDLARSGGNALRVVGGEREETDQKANRLAFSGHAFA
jgi:hypothetical protein